MTYKGSCHCQRVLFEVNTNIIGEATQCNCSICARKGILHFRVSASDFNLVSGEESLTVYKFGQNIANHYFCKFCGIHPFTNPKAAPSLYTVNLRCIEGIDISTLLIHHFDGIHWDDNVSLLHR